MTMPEPTVNPLVPPGEVHVVGATRAVIRDGRLVRYVEAPLLRPPTPQQVRELADQLESRECTGIAASWCPIHGTCCCPDPEDRNWPGCPLHAADSSHAAAAIADHAVSG